MTPPGKSDLRLPDVEVWLAVHPNVAIVAAGSNPDVGLILSLSPEVVRKVNRSIATQSEVFAGRDKASVASVARVFL
jgi:hypothetical protein